MATTHKPFRELVKPDSNFEFVGRTRVWVLISIALVIGSIAMLFVNNAVRGDYLNWTIDFKGGTEIILGFRDKNSNEHVSMTAGDVRRSLQGAGFDGFEVSDFGWTEELEGGRELAVKGMLVRTPTFGVVTEARRAEIITRLYERFGGPDAIKSARWSGDRIYVRTTQPISEDEARQFMAEFDLEMKDWTDKMRILSAVAEEGTGEYDLQIPVFGVERQYAKVIDEALGVNVELIQSYAVGARAGKELRNDGAKSLFYAVALIMLYLAFRFDIRYAPGAVVALFHDAILVVGVFAVTWTEVSLTTVAALLTVIGYSVNDSVVIFDRIRENVERLKDKKLARVINISLNETMSRTLLTSLTLLVVTLMMNVFGTGLVKNFAFAMNMGVIVGVYSSIFVAAPVLLYLDTRYYGGRAAAAGKAKKPTTAKP
jgi:preprotein translocase subunit SecF